MTGIVYLVISAIYLITKAAFLLDQVETELGINKEIDG